MGNLLTLGLMCFGAGAVLAWAVLPRHVRTGSALKATMQLADGLIRVLTATNELQDTLMLIGELEAVEYPEITRAMDALNAAKVSLEAKLPAIFAGVPALRLPVAPGPRR